MQDKKTTLSGAVSGLVILILSILGYSLDPDTMQLIVSISIAVGAIGITLVGYFAKDGSFGDIVAKIDKFAEAGKNIPNDKISGIAGDLDTILDALSAKIADMKKQVNNVTEKKG